jgi:hypothetical protein
MNREAFEAWWEKDGQFCRAGGGDYEKTFAFRAYHKCGEYIAGAIRALKEEV